MPDNSTNWSADDGFWDDAWTDMNRQLDEHMPLKKRRNPFLFWWLTGAGTLVLLLSVGYYGFLGLQSSNVEESSNDQRRPRQVNTIAESKVQPLATPAQVSKPAVLKPAPAPAKQATTQLQALPPTASEPIAQKTITATPPQPANTDSPKPQNRLALLKESLVNLPEGEENAYLLKGLNQQTPSTQLPVSSDETVANTPKIRTEQTANKLARSNQLLVAKREYDFTGLGKKLTQPKRKRTSLYLDALISHGTQSPGIGYGFGLALERQLTNKHSIAATLGFRAQRQQISLIAPVLATDNSSSFPTPVTEMQDSVSALYSTYDSYLENGSANFISSYDARLGLGYNYRFNQRWSIGAEIGLNYLLESYGPTLIGQFQSSEELMDDQETIGQSTSIIGAAFNSLNRSNFLGSQDETSGGLTARSLRADLGLKLGYQLNQRWQLNAGLRTYLSPVVESETIQLNPARLNIGLRVKIW